MRLFIAGNFSNNTRSCLQNYCDELRQCSEKGNFTLPDNLHITLAFLGECDENQAASAKQAMNAIKFDPFNITITSGGYFDKNKPNLVFCGLKNEDGYHKLLQLQSELSANLSVNGFKLEQRKFWPHITLGRKVVWKEGFNSYNITFPTIEESVNKINLMKSERVIGKLTYTSIHERGKKLKPITVEPYNSEWEVEFERIQAYLLSQIGDLIVKIHHIGSTSVPDLSAKPIIDFYIEIESRDMFPPLKERLEKLGFRHKGDFGITGREVFNREISDDFMEYNMYVCTSDSSELKRHIKFRDVLRANPIAVREYGALKIELAAKYGSDIDAYIDGKADFIRNILEN